MTELILHMNNYSITRTITAYQTYPKCKMNSVNVNLHSYCSKFVNIYNYKMTNVGKFQAKLCKFYTFFYYILTYVSALKCLNFKFFILKLCVKDKFMDQKSNNILLIKNLT